MVLWAMWPHLVILMNFPTKIWNRLRSDTVSIMLEWHSEKIDLIFCIAYHAVLSFFIKCVIRSNGNILSMCVLPVVVYDAAKRIVKLSSIVLLLIGEVNDHFTSEGHNTCSLVVIV